MMVTDHVCLAVINWEQGCFHVVGLVAGARDFKDQLQLCWVRYVAPTNPHAQHTHVSCPQSVSFCM